ncbi:hypothetical protein [Mycolicibacterium sp.]|uniref:hypothetical protein n=1 Tax=Mycolicibacterium sp. TaxID=2320850 RepID=UPI0037C8C823
MDANDAALSRRLDAITRVSERAVSKLSEVRGVGRVGVCTVTVNHLGHLVDIKFLTEASALDANGLATVSLRAYREACASAEKSTATILDALKKHPDILGSRITDGVDARRGGAANDDGDDVYDYHSNTWRQTLS